ncbi:MAG: ATP-dependent protease subunit HslV [Armatimonadota bacterium]
MKIRSTTVVAVRRNGTTALAADGQVTLGEVVLKGNARKVRHMYHGKVLAGFAGSVADAQALSDAFEAKLEASGGILKRAAVDFAKEWRTDRNLRRLEAMMIVADNSGLLLLSGDGNVIEPEGDVIAIGSGGNYATAAARALMTHTEFDAAFIAKEAMKIASELCIYTNDRIICEVLPAVQEA